MLRQRYARSNVDSVSPGSIELVREIAADVLQVDIDKVGPDTDLIEDLQADSLSLVEMVAALEEAFEVHVPEEDVDKIRTVQDAYDLLLRLS